MVKFKVVIDHFERLVKVAAPVEHGDLSNVGAMLAHFVGGIFITDVVEVVEGGARRQWRRDEGSQLLDILTCISQDSRTVVRAAEAFVNARGDKVRENTLLQHELVAR